MKADALRSLAGDPPAAPPRARGASAAVAAALAAALLLAAAPLLAWLALGAWALAASGAAYAGLLLAFGGSLWRGRWPTAGGVLVVAGALMVPFAFHGLEHALGWFPDGAGAPRDLGQLLRHPGFAVDVVAIAALAAAARRIRFPPLALPIVGAAWVLMMDLAPLATDDAVTWNERALLTVQVGLVATVLAVALDRGKSRPAARWLYLAGLALCCGGLASYEPETTAAVALRLALAAALVAAGPVLGRRSFAVFGALGLAAGAGRLASTAVHGPALVAVAFGIGFGVFVAAGAYARIDDRLGARLRAALPRSVSDLLPPRT